MEKQEISITEAGGQAAKKPADSGTVTAEINDDTFVKIEQSVELTKDELERLAKATIMSEYQRQKLDRDAKKNWDLFYKRNGDRFFKNRYWTRHEFQELFSKDDSCKETESKGHIALLEIGCGCGDFVLPLLSQGENNSQERNDAQSHCVESRHKPKDIFVYCCDISDRAINILKSNPVYLSNIDRAKAFVADITHDASQILNEFNGQLMDIVSLVFVLSAIDPNKMGAAIDNIYKVLRPGGLVLFRDYAIYDKAMLRFNECSKICDQFYVRQDGTRAYFFSKDHLVELFRGCKFHCQSIEYVRRETVNNATKDKFSRIFLQAKFMKTIA